MSNINFTCPHCSFQKQLPASAEGMQGNCPSCKAVVTIRADAPANPSVLRQQPAPQQQYPPQQQPVQQQTVQRKSRLFVFISVAVISTIVFVSGIIIFQFLSVDSSNVSSNPAATEEEMELIIKAAVTPTLLNPASATWDPFVFVKVTEFPDTNFFRDYPENGGYFVMGLVRASNKFGGIVPTSAIAIFGPLGNVLHVEESQAFLTTKIIGLAETRIFEWWMESQGISQ